MFQNAGIIDQHVYFDALVCQFARQFPGSAAPRKIGRFNQDQHSVIVDELARQLLELVFPARHQHDVVPTLGEVTCQRFSDTR
jgi:hypothetical protein